MTDTVNVPLEPTEAMIEAGVQAVMSFGRVSNGVCNAYRAMLAATPKAVNVPDPASMDDAPAWYTYEEASGWVCGWMACRDAMLAAAPKAVNVPDEASMDDAPAWCLHKQASGWACGWNACRDAALAAAPKAEPVSDPYKLDIEALAQDAAQRVHKNGGCVPQMAYAPILFALQDAFKDQPEAPKVEQEPVEITEDWQNQDLVDGFYFAKVQGFNGVGMTILRRKRGKWFHANTPSLSPVAVSTKPITGHHPAPASDELLEAAINLRAAQRAYMADRGNEMKGKAVGAAADRLDVAIAKHRGPQS